MTAVSILRVSIRFGAGEISSVFCTPAAWAKIRNTDMTSGRVCCLQRPDGIPYFGRRSDEDNRHKTEREEIRMVYTYDGCCGSCMYMNTNDYAGHKDHCCCTYREQYSMALR